MAEEERIESGEERAVRQRYTKKRIRTAHHIDKTIRRDCSSKSRLIALPIYITTMANLNNIDRLIPVIDRIDYPIIPDTNAPKITFAYQFSASLRARVFDKRLNLCKNSAYIL
jgi:hypothetical protein